VVIAPGRAKRPGAFLGEIEDPTAEELESCPFDAGREDRTPPQTLVLPEEGPWTVRVVPNLHPALERQEVVVHSPRHVRSFAELEDVELALVADAWRRRFAAAESEGFPYVHAMINEGRFAGASLAHSHSQLIWLRDPPPAVTREAEAEGCPVCDLFARRDLVFDETDGLVALCHPAGRVPFELLIAPRAHDPQAADEFAVGLALLRETVRRLRALRGKVPWNAWLHHGAHWHLEVVPRLTVFAGLELGAEIYVNVVEPEAAAAELREVTPSGETA
jgi:UDPglucose--hexose-1-phosphate uridylyltransferase